MEKIHHSLLHTDTVDDMQVLTYLVENIKGLRPVSGSAFELSLSEQSDENDF
ncbi:MAG: hypothetical protein ACTJG2_03875 [Candidatus Saccharimonadales bacterium]